MFKKLRTFFSKKDNLESKPKELDYETIKDYFLKNIKPKVILTDIGTPKKCLDISTIFIKVVFPRSYSDYEDNTSDHIMEDTCGDIFINELGTVVACTFVHQGLHRDINDDFNKIIDKY